MLGTPFFLRPRREAVVFALACVLSACPAAAQSTDTSDTSPSGMMAFFMATAAACPPGWTVATMAQGRLIVGVTNGSAVGVQVGTALTSESSTGQTAAPTHQHGYSGSVSISRRDIVADHRADSQGAQNGTYSLSGFTGAGTSNLPLMQLVVCQKQ